MASFPEFATVAEIRARYPDDVADDTDATIRQQLDQVTSQMEELLAHGFGRVATIQSTAAENVEITAVALIVGGDTYTLADYTTILELQIAVNGGGGNYSMELLPVVRPDISPQYLMELAATACGPTYDLRQVLSVSHDYHKATGGRSHVFLPLPLYSVNSIVESGTLLASTYYWAQVGASWIIRKYCNCVTDTCQHPTGCWKSTYPDNLLIYYRPAQWLHIPMSLQAAVIHAFGLMRNIDDNLQSESFLSYSYSRQTAPAMTWQQALNVPSINNYQVKADF